MKLCLFFMMFLSYVLIIQSLPNGDGVVFLSCPKDGVRMINCNEMKCCPSDNTTCCLDKSILNKGIRIACASIYPSGHPLGC
jgi:hypothetical protein